jgi:hypothetical protein
MGKSIISKMRDDAKQANKETRKEMEERLQIVEKMIHGKRDKAKQEMLVGEKNDTHWNGGGKIHRSTDFYIRKRI